MFGNIGPMELLLIFVLALLVFGPKKLPEIGRSVGKALREFKRTSEEIKGRIEDEIEASELKGVRDDLRQARQDLNEAGRNLQDTLNKEMARPDVEERPKVPEAGRDLPDTLNKELERHDAEEGPKVP